MDWTNDADAPYLGKVGQAIEFIDVTVAVDTSIYAPADVLFVTTALTNALRLTNGKGTIQSMVVIDRDDEGAVFDLYLLSANVAMGTINAGASISDDDAGNILGTIPVAAADYKDLGGVKVACFANLNRLIKAVDGTKNIYIAAVILSGTPTFTAATDLRFRFGISQG